MTDAVIEAQEIAAESAGALTEAKAFRISSQEQYIASAGRLQNIKALQKKVADAFDPHIKRAYDAHKALVAEKNTHLSPLTEAEGHIKRAVLAYTLAEEAKRREAEAKLQEEARKEREKLEAQAAKAAEKGKTEKAAALQERASAVVAPIVAPSMPKVSGISTRITYKAEVTSKITLLKAIVEGKVPLVAVDINMAFLNTQARALKETLEYPGVKVVQETGLASRSA